MRTPAETLAIVDNAQNILDNHPHYDATMFDLRELVWEVILDLIGSVRDSPRPNGKDIAEELMDYAVNHYGDD